MSESHNPFDEALSVLRGEVRHEVEELKTEQQRQREKIVELTREIEELKLKLLPPRLNVPHPDRRRARRAELKFAPESQS